MPRIRDLLPLNPHIPPVDLSIPTVIIDNVAQYYMTGTSQDIWDIQDDFPCLTPPFPHLFMEHRPVNEMITRQGREKAPPEVRDIAMACHVFGHKVIDAADFAKAWKSLADSKLERPASWLIPSWIVVCLLLAARRRRVGPVAMWVLELDESGQVLKDPNDVAQMTAGRLSDSIAEESLHDLRESLHPFLLALSFMHCRNVTLVPGPPPPPKLSRAFQKKHGHPLVRYHVLQIEAMKQVLRTEGKSEEVGLRKALHICRGHFSHYGESYGTGKLFGRLEGRFWIPQHIRGSREQGLVLKDYEVSR